MIYKVSLATLISVIILIIAGATVTSTGAGDSVPDWPLAYGRLIPPLHGNIIYEYIHRVIAGIVTLLLLTLTVLCWILQTKKIIRILSTTALIAIICQALLGGIRVLIISDEKIWQTIQFLTGKISNKNLKLIFAIIHAILAQTVLSIIFIILTISSPQWNNNYTSNYPTTSKNHFLQTIALLLLTIVFTQTILGAIVRHKQIGLTIPDFPTTFGHLIPNFNNIPYNPHMPYPLSYDEFKFNIILNFFHTRILPLMITALVFLLFFIAKKSYMYNKQLIRSIYIVITQVIIQLSLGILVIWLKAPIILTVIHTAVGASILGIAVNLVLLSFIQK